MISTIGALFRLAYLHKPCIFIYVIVTLKLVLVPATLSPPSQERRVGNGRCPGSDEGTLDGMSAPDSYFLDVSVPSV